MTPASRRFDSRLSNLALLVALGLLAGGCATAPRLSPPATPASTSPSSVPSLPQDRGDGSSGIAGALTEAAQTLLRAPYRYSGNDPGGFDCSGFTSFVFRSVGLDLPRTAAQQAQVGAWVAPDELSAGDLVFFGEQRNKPFHVGLVVSRSGEPLTMIHASTSEGVIETKIQSSSYWLARLLFGRRALGDG